jgi:hypothetical protein
MLPKFCIDISPEVTQTLQVLITVQEAQTSMVGVTQESGIGGEVVFGSRTG